VPNGTVGIAVFGAAAATVSFTPAMAGSSEPRRALRAGSRPLSTTPDITTCDRDPAGGSLRSRATANHRTNSTGLTDGFVEIIVARNVRHARLQPLKRGWEGPKNLGAVVSTKSYSVSTEPIFETSRPSCSLQGAVRLLQGGPGPLEARCHQKIPSDPIGDERAEGGSLLRRICRVARLQPQPDRRGRQDIWSAKRPFRGPPGPRVRNWSKLASRSVVADQRARRNVPENVLSIIPAPPQAAPPAIAASSRANRRSPLLIQFHWLAADLPWAAMPAAACADRRAQ
jgi:hypothetical protein